jgi:hypothetical protein
VGVPDAVILGVNVAVTLGVRDNDEPTEGVPVPVGVNEGVTVGDLLAVIEGVLLGVRVTLGVTEGVPDFDGVTDGVTLPDPERVTD